ncbi:alanine--tRNA ligase [Onchocerca flexuosa]|uniref:Alanine--tRNA ligase n=2 Tax=Onchocerca flexuosa TaxID=387005 RepID=A0A238BP07_9BILA|nr:alanine--tRNA ligase [Onchocerca flexuosa]
MKVLSCDEVRAAFINFFKDREHTYVHSSSVIPFDDPTLLFANAGMNQYKPIFLGTIEPSSEMAKLKRAVNTQKCIRAGGKHNDLDDVGKDVYHHTFFEMLGNWSFGDYFKLEVCNWAWELLTKVFGIPGERLYVSYFGGDEKTGLAADEECRQIWLNIGVPPSHILSFGMKDNFWEMGSVGPCGPCSEIHYDRIGNRDASHLVNADDPMEDGSLKQLPRKHIDCGLGFERLVAVLQNKLSNYDTDIFTPLFDAIHTGTKIRPYSGKIGVDDVDGIDMAYRVVADHIRTLSIALSDGGRPDNTGRGYVLRRILRRAVRYANEKLLAPPGFLSSLVPTVVNLLGKTFPELHKDPQTVMDIINDEEKQFLKTLNRGRRLFQKAVASLQGRNILSGDVAWRLYDTYGFPLDLTQLMAEERGLVIDLELFENCRQEAAELSAAHINKMRGTIDLDVNAISELKNKGIPATDDSPKYRYHALPIEDQQTMYSFEECEGVILALRKDKMFVDTLNSGDFGALILDRTNFYAEQGGQIFDTGVLTKVDEGSEFIVSNVQIRGGYVVLVGSAEGELSVGDKVIQIIDEERRNLIMKNHTGTHVLNFALRKIIGEIEQKGSLVAPDRLRFDFTSKQSLTYEQIKMVEEESQKLIDTNATVFAKNAPLAEARQINGLRAVFEEAYPDPVRIVSVGVPIEELLKNMDSDLAVSTAVEFCGGTHLHNVGHIGKLVITAEEAIAKGIRRIIALTGPEASRAIHRANRLEQRVEETHDELATDHIITLDKIQFKAATKRVLELIEEVNQSQLPYCRKENIRKKAKALQKLLDTRDREAKAVLAEKVQREASELDASLNGDTVFTVHIFSKGANGKVLDGALKLIKKSHAVMGFSINDDIGKVVVVARVSKDVASKGLQASEWISQVCKVLDGRGGGTVTQAQATGNNIDSVEEAAEVALKFAKITLS